MIIVFVHMWPRWTDIYSQFWCLTRIKRGVKCTAKVHRGGKWENSPAPLCAVQAFNSWLISSTFSHSITAHLFLIIFSHITPVPWPLFSCLASPGCEPLLHPPCTLHLIYCSFHICILSESFTDFYIVRTSQEVALKAWVDKVWLDEGEDEGDQTETWSSTPSLLRQRGEEG